MKIAIGIDLDWPFEHHYGVVRGILEYGKERGWTCGLEPWMETTGYSFEIPEGYDGVISRVTPHIEEACLRQKIPLVNVWYNSPVKNVPFVGIDNELLGRKMASHFVNKGFKKILFLGLKEDLSCKVVFEGVEECLSSQEIPTDSLFLKTPILKEEWEDFNSQLDHWLANFEYPLALVVSDHILARYLCEWCAKREVMVPDDIAILSGCSNDLICESFEPSLSHIQNKFDTIGRGAAETLNKIINNEAIDNKLFLPPGELIERRSTDVEPIDDRLVAKAMRFIWDNSTEPIMVSDVARVLKVSRRTLERKFREAMDRSVNQEILRTKIERAQKMLINSDLTVKKISEQAGFASNQRMSQVFKRKLGMTALEYREQNKSGMT